MGAKSISSCLDRAMKYFNELWCPSRFIQSSVSQIYERPSLYMPPAFNVEDSKGFSRNYFNLPEEQFIFLFVFDFKSYSSRKNPLGCIKAFQNAFPENNKTVGLVIKSMDGNKYPDEFKDLIKAAQNDLRIKFIDETFTAKEVVGLMSVCDAFVSLHRAEGDWTWSCPEHVAWQACYSNQLLGEHRLYPVR